MFFGAVPLKAIWVEPKRIGKVGNPLSKAVAIRQVFDCAIWKSIVGCFIDTN